MHATTFEYVSREEIPSFITRPQEQAPPIVPPAVPPALPSEEITALSLLSESSMVHQPETPPENRTTRIYLPSTDAQRKTLLREYAEHGIRKPLSYYMERTRLSKPTLKRLIKKLQEGEDITKPKKRGRKPRFTPELLKEIASRLCTRNMTLRQAQKDIHLNNMAAIEDGREVLPEVSVTTIHRYVSNDQLMDEVDVGPISFTEVTLRGPAANSPENKELRIARRKELDACIRAGYMAIFVDESHWSVGNVRTRGWGSKGEKHYRTTDLSSFSLSCICAVTQSGEKYCKIFNVTITNEIFVAYMKEFIALCRLEHGNAVFVMDNASIHRNEVRELAERNGCKVLYNAPYSPECNPIELVFGVWKTKVGKLSNTNIAGLLENISQCFEAISKDTIRSCVNHFLGPVTIKVMNREDL